MNKKVSIVIPVYNEEESLEKLYFQIKDVLSDNKLENYEIIFVNDGSSDNSVAIIKELIMNDGNIRLISFRRNFGKAMVLETAFHNVTGDIIITMDADLQDDPAEIPNFIERIEAGYDLVSGWKYNRQDPLEKRLPSKLFNRVTSVLSGVKLHDFNCGFKAYRRIVTDNIDIYGELHRYIPVLASRKGFRITEIKVHHNKREFGKSKYGIERYLRGLFDSISVSFVSKFYDRPMYFFGRLGLITFLLGFFVCLYLSIEWCMGVSIGNRPLLLLGVLMILLGVQFFSVGFIGDMLVDATYRNRYDESHVEEKI